MERGLEKREERIFSLNIIVKKSVGRARDPCYIYKMFEKRRRGDPRTIIRTQVSMQMLRTAAADGATLLPRVRKF